MTYPLTPFKPGTPLYPPHWHILQYLEDVASGLNSTGEIHLSHKVEQATFDSHLQHPWTLHLYDRSHAHREPFIRHYDHLVIASGHNHYPYMPSWHGSQEWLDTAPTKRFITHSIWYREPERYKGQMVVVVGAAASGNDMASQVVPYVEKVSAALLQKEDAFLTPVLD